jgi:sulfoxide reductase heme-binding subunit YedZ
VTLSVPWRDRAGRLSWLRIAALAFIVFPALLLGHAAWTEALGPEPLKTATHETGRMAIRLLLASLAVTPFGRILGFPKLFQLRRMLGLAALAWASFHLLLYVGDQNWRLWRVAIEIASRFYLVLGFTALCGLAVLGWTSTDAWMKRLGRRWKRLHRLVFPIAVLALLHAFIQSKADTSQAVLMAGLFVWLMGWRALPARFQSSWPPIGGLAVATLIGAVALEYAWYAVATNLPAWRIALANLDLSFGPRPAVQAGLAAGRASTALVAARRLAPRRRPA